MRALITCSYAIGSIIIVEEQHAIFLYESMVVNKDLEVLWLKLGHTSTGP